VSAPHPDQHRKWTGQVRVLTVRQSKRVRGEVFNPLAYVIWEHRGEPGGEHAPPQLRRTAVNCKVHEVSDQGKRRSQPCGISLDKQIVSGPLN
jgi:hypothetical protein